MVKLNGKTIFEMVKLFKMLKLGDILLKNVESTVENAESRKCLFENIKRQRMVSFRTQHGKRPLPSHFQLFSEITRPMF
jgi:hypothetical protein